VTLQAAAPGRKRWACITQEAKGPARPTEDTKMQGERAGAKHPWLVVLGSALALTVGNGPIMHFTFGVFLKPITAEFNIDRGLASLALMIGVSATAVALPFAGRLADRLGPRPFGLAAVTLFGLAIIAVGALSRSVWGFALASA
jgi:MFS family permease